jgi:hypothetical protein
MKQKLLLLACIVFNAMLYAQSLAVPMALEAFKTKAGTQTLFIEPVSKTDSYGNIYTAGSTINGSGDYDIFLTKTNSAGVQLWQQQIPGATGGMDFAAGMAVTDTYVVLTGGISTSTVSPATDIFTMKLSASTGSVSWTSTYDGSGNSYDAGRHVAIDGSGNIYVTGGGYNASFNTDYIILKYSSTGTQTWASTWDYLGYDDCSIKVAISGSNLTITGAVTTATASTYKLATLTLAQSTGSLLATNVSTAITTSSVDIVSDMAADASSGNLVLAGCNYVSGQMNNFYVQKFSPTTLASAFTYTWNGPSSLNDVARAVGCDASGNIFVAGYSTSSTLGRELTILKLNSSGVLQYSVTSGFSGDDEAADLTVDASGNVYVTGYKTNSSGNKDYYTAKYSSTLSKTWEVSADGLLLNDEATNIALDSLDNLIVAGSQETSPGVSEYVTYKYVQKDVLLPIDLNSEPNNQFLSFTPNLGQLYDTSFVQNTTIKYYNTDISPAVFVKENLNSFMFIKDIPSSTIDSVYRIDMSYGNSNEGARPYALEQVEEIQNFYTCNLSEGLANVHASKRLFVPDVYPDIDVHHYSNADGLKYYFVVKPGGDPRVIELDFTGAAHTYTNGNNQLVISASWDSLAFNAPVIYQMNGATTVTVSGAPQWSSSGTNTYSISLPGYNTSLPLVIMLTRTPGIFAPSQSGGWRTYLGSYGAEVAQDVAADDSSAIYVSGYAANVAMYTGAVGNGTVQGQWDGTVHKFDKNANLKWTTVWGGSGSEQLGSVVASNYNGVKSVYTTGWSSSNVVKAYIYPTSNPNNGTHWDNIAAGACDGAIIKLSEKTGIIGYAQYFGGCNDDKGISIAADNLNGRIYIAGQADDHFTCAPTLDFPVKDPGANSYYSNVNANSYVDAFIFCMDLNHVIQYSSFIGGSGDEEVGEIAVNQTTGDFYITGATNSAVSTRTTSPPYTPLNDGKFPLGSSGSGFFQPTRTASYYCGYISRFNQNYELQWSTLFNGDGRGFGRGLDIAPNGDLYTTGISYSTKTSTVNCGVPDDDGFPVCNAYQTAAYGDDVTTADIYLARFNSSNALIYSTLYGNDDMEEERLSYAISPKLCVDKNNNVFVAGSTSHQYGSNLFPTLTKTGLYNQSTNLGTSNPKMNAFILWFDANNVRQWASLYGGAAGGEAGNSIAVTPVGQVHMVGPATSNSLSLACPTPVGGTPYCKNFASNSTGSFIARFDMGSFVGIKENTLFNTKNELLVYPNPSNSNISITFKGRELDHYMLEIYNTMGQLVYKKDLGKTFGQHTEMVDVSSYSTGVYIINLVSSKDVLSTKLIRN